MPRKNPSYRRAIVEDLASVHALAQVVNRLHHGAWPDVFAHSPDPATEKAHWLKSLQGDTAATFLACVEGTNIGFVTVQILEEDHCLLQQLRYARVGTLCVAEAMRGRGIGRALMEHAQRWASSCGAAEMRLEVWNFNLTAVRLYEELGYELRSLAMSKPISLDQADSCS